MRKELLAGLLAGTVLMGTGCGPEAVRRCYDDKILERVLNGIDRKVALANFRHFPSYKQVLEMEKKVRKEMEVVKVYKEEAKLYYEDEHVKKYRCKLQAKVPVFDEWVYVDIPYTIIWDERKKEEIEEGGELWIGKLKEVRREKRK